MNLRVSRQQGILLKLDFEKAYGKVNWSFLKEVVERKGFIARWIEWVMQAVQRGRVAIDLNGERGPYFRSFKGLRQGDPLSPILLNLEANVLSTLLTKANRERIISGLISNLVEGGLTHLQYVDDTAILLEKSNSDINNIRFILSCYEAMSGMKINYEKSEVFVVGATKTEQHSIAESFNCKVGVLPIIIYLGLPVSDLKITKNQLHYVAIKSAKRLGTWQGDHLSYSGKSNLISSYLSSIPLYHGFVYVV